MIGVSSMCHTCKPTCYKPSVREEMSGCAALYSAATTEDTATDQSNPHSCSHGISYEIKGNLWIHFTISYCWPEKASVKKCHLNKQLKVIKMKGKRIHKEGMSAAKVPQGVNAWSF